MKKTLIVNYTPRNGSNTKKLVDSFIELNKNKTEISILDLAKTPPDLLLEENLNLYVKRDFGGVILNEDEQQTMLHNDKMVSQLIETDFIVLVSPLYNFSIPATVKSWFDAVISAGKTFTQTEVGPKGLCENKQALVLMTSGSDFGSEPLKNVNFATPLIKTCFGLMGIHSESIIAFGLQQYAEKSDRILEDAKNEIKTFSTKWY